MELRTKAEQVGKFWRDQDGFLGPVRPGQGPRRDPDGDFPTGPAIGQPLGPVSGLATDGTPADLDAIRSGGPAIVVFFRSAVW